MADVNIKKSQSARQGSALAPSERPTWWTPSTFSRSPRDWFWGNTFDWMRRFMDEMDWTSPGMRSRGAMRPLETEGWTPLVESFERDGNLVVRAELPGVKKEDVKVEITDDGLFIQGERKREHEERGADFYRSEWSYGSFCRCIPLPAEAIKAENARAQFENGVLEVSIPIPETQRRRREIAIEEGRGEKKKTAA